MESRSSVTDNWFLDNAHNPAQPCDEANEYYGAPAILMAAYNAELVLSARASNGEQVQSSTILESRTGRRVLRPVLIVQINCLIENHGGDITFSETAQSFCTFAGCYGSGRIAATSNQSNVPVNRWSKRLRSAAQSRAGHPSWFVRLTDTKESLWTVAKRTSFVLASSAS